MPDKIYVTYTPTTAPGTYHTAVHFERTDTAGTTTHHFVIEAQPENLNELGASDKGLGVIEEGFRNDDGPTRFGRITAAVKQWNAKDYDANAPYEPIAEGDDLSENLARMRLYALGVNDAGFTYRGQHQNSNSFASGALQAGGLRPASGVAYDPEGPTGELLEYFAPGLNEPLRPPIGTTGTYSRPSDSNSPTIAPLPSVTGKPPLPFVDEYRQYQDQANGNNTRASAATSSSPAVPVGLPTNPNSSGNDIASWIASLAGVDPRNPAQGAPPPLDDGLRDFYRNDPAWFLQLRR